MKKLTTLMMIVFMGFSYAQKNPASLPGSNGPSQADFKNTSQSLLSNLANSVGPKATVKLQKYYEANDGSYIYVRQIDDMVYALAERFDNRFVSVLVGKIVGGKFDAQYYYIPKGKAKGQGQLTFKIEQRGRKLTLTSNNPQAPFNFESMTGMGRLPTKLPTRARAWYRGNTRSNLTGRWGSDNVGMTHLLDTNGKIIAYISGSRKTHTRPQFASIFIGEKKAGRIDGHYVDIPLGHTYGGGETGFIIEGPHNLRVDKNYFPGVKHKRKLDDNNEVIQ